MLKITLQGVYCRFILSGYSAPTVNLLGFLLEEGGITSSKPD